MLAIVLFWIYIAMTVIVAVVAVANMHLYSDRRFQYEKQGYKTSAKWLLFCYLWPLLITKWLLKMLASAKEALKDG